MADVSSHASSSPNAAIDLIEARLDALAAAARRDLEEGEFHRQLVTQAGHALAARSVRLWTKVATQAWRREPAAFHSEAGESNGVSDGAPPTADFDAAVAARAPLALTLSAGAAHETLFLAPFTIEADRSAVLEVSQRGELSAEAERGCLRLLAAIAGIAEGFHHQREIEHLRSRHAVGVSLEDFTRRVYANLGRAEAAYATANETRRLLGVDRASLLVRRGDSFALEAASGVEQVNRRAESTRALEQLARAVAKTREPLIHDGQPVDLAPQIEEPLHAYLESTPVRAIALVPLFDNAANGDGSPRPAAASEPIGVLVSERFEGPRRGMAMDGMLGVASLHAGLALARSLEFERRSAIWPVRVYRAAAERAASRRTAIAAALLVVAGAILAGWLVPAELRVTARGELQPGLRREVFATANGIVEKVLVEHGQNVVQSQELAELRRTELDFEFAKVLGETQTAEQRLAAVRASRVGLAPATDEETRKYNELTAEEEQLKSQLASLAEQLAVLRREQEELVVRSPIAGQVVTWNVAEMLASRPVERGQRLLTVADVDGAWVVEIDVPDRDAGHVLAAWKNGAKPLPIEFALATEPGRSFGGTVERVALATVIDERSEEPIVRVTAAVDAVDELNPRPGATVRAKIDCGQRPIGYVWFHDVWHTLQSFLF